MFATNNKIAMKLAILTNGQAKEEWLSRQSGSAQILWVDNVDELCSTPADAWFDLEFEYQADRVKKLAAIQGPVFINSVIHPLINSGLPVENTEFIRINAWPTFLQRPLTEVAIADPFAETTVREVFGALGWKHWIVPDVPGMISPRVIAMIINEAYYTLQAEVSSKAEIDTAMKLGTNYPYGPFEWSNKIGLKNIHALLTELSKTDQRYLPSEKLQQDAGAISTI
jgi:3-hydroxybutyryl-CoA dehydrogenase